MAVSGVYIGTGATWQSTTADGTTVSANIDTDPFNTTTVILVASSEWKADDTRLREALRLAAQRAQEWEQRTTDADIDADEFAKLERLADDVQRPPVTAPLDTPPPVNLNDEHGPQWLPQGQAPTWQRPPP